MLNKSAHSQIEMEPELLATKLHEPPRPNAVPRPHLIAHLNEGLTHPVVTLLSASAGFGKTTLLSTWLNQLSAPTRVAWIALNDGDSDPTIGIHLDVGSDREISATGA